MIGTLAEGFLWSGNTDRRGFLFATGLSFVLIVGLAVAISASGPFAPVTSALFIIFGLLAYPLVGITVRRLHHLGRSGGWAFLLLIPFIGLGLALMLLILPEQNRPHRPGPVIISRIGQIIVVGLAVLLISRVWWAPFWIPSASMKPTLLPGDYVIATRVTGPPERGGVYIFRPTSQSEAFVKRLIGLPGEEVQLKSGQLVINGAEVPLREVGPYLETYERSGPAQVWPTCQNDGVAVGADCLKTLQQEELPGGTRHRLLDIRTSMLDDWGPMLVPEWGAFFMGDNRDNSVDSRLVASAGGLGMVPVQNVIARVDRVLFSARGPSFFSVWDWRAGRYWTAVE